MRLDPSQMVGLNHVIARRVDGGVIGWIILRRLADVH